MQKILVVDDSPEDIEITRIALTEMDHAAKVEAMPDGKTALEYLRSNVRDLPTMILLDLKMPGISGIDVLRQMRDDGHLKSIPVIVVTSSSLEEDERDAYKAGADGFLHKAFNMDEFTGGLDALLRRYLNN